MANSQGMGPLELDTDMAERHGWTSAEVAGLWDELVEVYKRRLAVVVARHPERFRRVGPMSLLMFVGDHGPEHPKT